MHSRPTSRYPQGWRDADRRRRIDAYLSRPPRLPVAPPAPAPVVAEGLLWLGLRLLLLLCLAGLVLAFAVFWLFSENRTPAPLLALPAPPPAAPG